MNREILKLNIIIALQVLGLMAILFEENTTVKFVFLGISIVFVLGLIFRVELVRKIQVAFFILSTILGAIFIVVIIGLSIYMYGFSTPPSESETEVTPFHILLAVAVQMVVVAYSWWGAKHLSTNYIKRQFTTNKASKKDAQ